MKERVETNREREWGQAERERERAAKETDLRKRVWRQTEREIV